MPCFFKRESKPSSEQKHKNLGLWKRNKQFEQKRIILSHNVDWKPEEAPSWRESVEDAGSSDSCISLSGGHSSGLAPNPLQSWRCRCRPGAFPAQLRALMVRSPKTSRPRRNRVRQAVNQQILDHEAPSARLVVAQIVFNDSIISVKRTFFTPDIWWPCLKN